MSRIVVIGGGLCGLTAGFRISQAGHEVIVLERADEVGGSARTERHAGYLIDTGADVINAGYRRYLALADEVGLKGDIVASSRVVDVIRDGRPASFDSANPSSLLRAPLLSRRARLQLARGHLRTRRQVKRIDPFALTRYTAEGDRPAYDFAVSAFGTEAAEHLIDPVVRAFAGTGLQHTSALAVLGALSVGRHDVMSVRGGMRAVPAALASRLDARCGVSVKAVQEDSTGVTVIADDEEIRADACVLAVMYEDAQLIWPSLAAAMPEFRATLHPVPLINVSLGYGVEAATEAYSILVPTVEEPDALLAFMQQHKAPDRVPDGRTLITLFTEALSAHRFADRSDDDIVSWADDLVTRWYPELAGHRDVAVVTRWPRTGYVPTPGFWQRATELRRALPNERVQVSSTVFGSGSIERAVLGGERAAERLLKSDVMRPDTEVKR